MPNRASTKNPEHRDKRGTSSWHCWRKIAEVELAFLSAFRVELWPLVERPLLFCLQFFPHPSCTLYNPLSFPSQPRPHFYQWFLGFSFVKAGPLEAILVIFGCRALIFFWKLLEKYKKMTPLLCACAVVITFETQKSLKRAPRSVENNFFINCDRS